MNNLSEEEKTIEYIKDLITWHREKVPDRVYVLNNTDVEKIKGILDLYRQEKEKNEKLEQEIEEEDLTVIYLDGFYYGEKKWKDKIEKKIKELKNKYKDEVKTVKDYDTNQFVVDCVAVLEELLEE